MDRFFLDSFLNYQPKLSPSDEHHLRTVLRYQVGKTFEGVFEGKLYLLKVVSLTPFQATMIEELPVSEINRPKVTLLYCLPKKDKLDWVVQKATELGVYEIVLVASRNNVVKWGKEEVEKKLLRYQKVAIEASQQAKRVIIPLVKSYLPFKEALKLDFDLKLLADENATSEQIFNLNPEVKCVKSIAILIGSEGGFIKEEISQAHFHHYQSISLGAFILRTETAPVVALSILNYLISNGKICLKNGQ